jgi:hypothetical protein
VRASPTSVEHIVERRVARVFGKCFG